jgi:hypothetical protein
MRALENRVIISNFIVIIRRIFVIKFFLKIKEAEWRILVEHFLNCAKHCFTTLWQERISLYILPVLGGFGVIDGGRLSAWQKLGAVPW